MGTRRNVKPPAFLSILGLLLENLPNPWHTLIPNALIVCMLGKYLPLTGGGMHI